MRVLFLVSSGIDSPVAAYLGIRKGWKPTFLYFDNYPFLTKESKHLAIKKIKRLMEITGIHGKIIIVPHGKDLEIITENCRRNLSCLLCKRMMYRKAEIIANIHGCDVIATGEIIGEQASQTIRNLILNDKVVRIPIIRPLLGLNKIEVESIAIKIGTIEVYADSCKAAAIRARTKAKEEELTEEERKIPVENLIEHSIKELEIL
ncbi:MAG: hypothetical protein NZ922_04670 [Candidatus Methanomethyliaceae archaeon]|nr:hypothetical protein [Candidatus Methanomethyliaceae archaeon]MDW7971121.1 hypothetical protein [Nitrososphaerota archaeon]